MAPACFEIRMRKIAKSNMFVAFTRCEPFVKSLQNVTCHFLCLPTIKMLYFELIDSPTSRYNDNSLRRSYVDCRTSSRAWCSESWHSFLDDFGEYGISSDEFWFVSSCSLFAECKGALAGIKTPLWQGEEEWKAHRIFFLGEFCVVMHFVFRSLLGWAVSGACAEGMDTCETSSWYWLLLLMQWVLCANGADAERWLVQPIDVPEYRAMCGWWPAMRCRCCGGGCRSLRALLCGLKAFAGCI